MTKVTGRRAFTVGGVLRRTFPIWFRNIIPFTILSAVVYSPLLLYHALAGEKQGLGQRALVSIASNAFPLILTGAIVYGVFEQVRGQQAGFFKCLRVGLTRLIPVLGVAIVVAVLVGIGTLLFFIPGIILQLMFWVAVPVAVVERLGVGASMKRSMQLTAGERGTIFVINLVLGVLFIVVTLLVAMALASGDARAGILILLATVPFGALTSVANAVGYHDLRVAKEGVGIEDLVAVFA